MPITYVCKRCGYVLYRFERVGQDCYGLPSPAEVINMYGGICPRCKADLRPPSVEDIVEKIKYSITSHAARPQHTYMLGTVAPAPAAETA